MKLLLILFILISTSFCLAQTEKLDKLELRDGTVHLGNVVKITTQIVEFKDSGNGLLYEYEKKDIRYIQLGNDEILTFEDAIETAQEKGKTETQPETIIIERESGTSVGIIILATLGALLGLLLIIGAIAQ